MSEPADPVPQDTAPQDTAPQDTAPQDTAPQDTAPQDTAPQDTAPQDTAPQGSLAAIRAGEIPPALRATAGVSWRLLVVGALVWVVLQFLGLAFPVVLAIFFAMLMTALAGPVARFIGRVLPKVLSIVIALLLIAVATLTIVGLVVRSIVSEASNLTTAIQDGIDQINDWLQHGPLQLTGDQLTELDTDVGNWAKSAAESAAGALVSELGAVGTLITAGSVFLFGTFFFMANGRGIWAFIVGWMPRRARAAIDVSGNLAWTSIAGYTRGIVLVALADGFLVLIGLLILQVPLAPALAAVVFLGAFIPVIGAPIATLLAAVVALATKGPVTAILVVALTVVVGSFDGDILQPLVMGKAVNLHPLAIVTVIAAGAIGFGIVGALIGVPLVAAAYGVAKYLSGRDPDHPFPPANAPPPAIEGPALDTDSDATQEAPAT
ncbi:MAG: AI-2E family transporter [Candidatus Nanopelagicales bacterium]